MVRGRADAPGDPVRELLLGSPPGPVLHLVDRGAAVRALHVSDRAGARRNVVLGHRNVQCYGESRHYLGSTVGRYANRIAGGRFVLDGVQHQLPVNDRGNHLHGGPAGFHQRAWAVDAADARSALLSLVSPDGDEGYPGELAAKVRFEVTDSAVRIAVSARCTAPTIVNLTSHAYFCLTGEDAGSVADHVLEVDAETYLPVDGTGLPTGPVESVAGTPFDFRGGSPLGPVMDSSHPQVRASAGVDHTLVLNGHGMRRVAALRSPDLMMELWTDQPGLQVYTGNQLDGSTMGTSGSAYHRGAGIALEPQTFPDSPNRPAFPSPVLRPHEEYRCSIEWRFCTDD